MFPYADPTTTLLLHQQKVDQMIREAADRERVRSATAGRNRRFARWRKKEARGRGKHVAATA